jgi:hypothetical protein
VLINKIIVIFVETFKFGLSIIDLKCIENEINIKNNKKLINNNLLISKIICYFTVLLLAGSIKLNM